MTNFLGQAVKFGKFFPLFELYWDFCREREKGSNPTEILILTMTVYERLKKEWINHKWEIDELNWICHALDHNDSMCDPSNFETRQIAYLDHAKTCFYLEHNNY